MIPPRLKALEPESRKGDPMHGPHNEMHPDSRDIPPCAGSLRSSLRRFSPAVPARHPMATPRNFRPAASPLSVPAQRFHRCSSTGGSPCITTAIPIPSSRTVRLAAAKAFAVSSAETLRKTKGSIYPASRRDQRQVAQPVRTCHVCQLAGKRDARQGQRGSGEPYPKVRGIDRLCGLRICAQNRVGYGSARE